MSYRTHYPNLYQLVGESIRQLSVEIAQRVEDGEGLGQIGACCVGHIVVHALHHAPEARKKQSCLLAFLERAAR